MSDLCVNVYTYLRAKESKVSYPSCEARPEGVSRTHGKCRPLTMDNLNFNSITHLLNPVLINTTAVICVMQIS